MANTLQQTIRSYVCYVFAGISKATYLAAVESAGDIRFLCVKESTHVTGDVYVQ